LNTTSNSSTLDLNNNNISCQNISQIQQQQQNNNLINNINSSSTNSGTGVSNENLILALRNCLDALLASNNQQQQQQQQQSQQQKVQQNSGNGSCSCCANINHQNVQNNTNPQHFNQNLLSQFVNNNNNSNNPGITQ